MLQKWTNFFLIRQPKQQYSKEFRIVEMNIAIERIKWLNVFMLLFSIHFFYNDYSMQKIMENKEYINRLFLIHIYLASVASVFLIIAFIVSKFSKTNVLLKTIIVDVYVVLSIIVGVLISLNSVYYTLTITIYTTIGIFIAVFIPLKPNHSVPIYSVIHFGFLFFLMQLKYDSSAILINQINSTVVIGVSLFLSVIFFYLRRNDFVNKKKIIESQASIDALFEISPFPICIVDYESSKILKINKRAKEQYKIELSEKTAFIIKDFFVYESDFIKFEQELKTCRHLDDYIVEVTNIDDIRWIMFNCEIIEYNGFECVLMAITDITKLKKIEKELTNKAAIDYLTGVLNRSKGIEIVEELISKKNEFTLVFCDINSLKMINDVYGHQDGDYAIKLISQAVNSVLTEGEELFRFGGDEFIIIIKSENNELISKRIKSIEFKIRSMEIEADKPYSISASFGYAIADKTKNQTAEELVMEADKKMYERKKQFHQEQDSNS